MAAGELLALELLVAAFAGGAFGATLGALPAFVFTGFLVIVGETMRILRNVLAPETAAFEVTELLAFGVVFGPHVSFAGGAAAAAYAARRGYIETTYRPHPAKEITVGLGTRLDVLLIGGLFGMAGHLLFVASVGLGAPWDPVAMGVVLSALLHRFAFGYHLVGPLDIRRLFDSSVYDCSLAATDSRPAIEPWLRHMYRWRSVATVGIVVGILGGYLAYVTASPFLGFGISAATLVFMVGDVDRIPVTHHMTLPSSTAVLALGGFSVGELTPAAVASGVPLWQALLVGAVFGLVGALLGELSQRLFYAHGETHFDPPAASIVVTTALISLSVWLGVFESAVWLH